MARFESLELKDVVENIEEFSSNSECDDVLLIVEVVLCIF